jgi:hypothetical protein
MNERNVRDFAFLMSGLTLGLYICFAVWLCTRLDGLNDRLVDLNHRASAMASSAKSLVRSE